MRRNFLVPVPSFESFHALNAHPERRCLERMDARLRGHQEDHRPAHGAGPGGPAAPAGLTLRYLREAGGPVSSRSLVRYRTNDYSAPVAYGHRDVLVRGYVDQVVISCGSEVIARHPRPYQQDDFVYDPIHQAVAGSQTGRAGPHAYELTAHEEGRQRPVDGR